MPEQSARDWRPGSRSGEADVRSEDSASVQLKEETLNVGKHEVEAGGVRLRKVTRTEPDRQTISEHPIYPRSS